VRREAILIHDDSIGGTRYSLDAGEAYLALSRPTGKEIVSCVITRGAEASHHLPGIGCGQEDVLRSHLGEHYDETSTRSSAERRFVESTTLSMSGESASPPHVRRQFLGDPRHLAGDEGISWFDRAGVDRLLAPLTSSGS